MSYLGGATIVLVMLGACIGAAVQMPWTGAAAGLAISVGLVIFLGD